MIKEVRSKPKSRRDRRPSNNGGRGSRNGDRWPIPPAQRFLLHDVDWKAYESIGDALLDRPALQLTYERGSLEFMTTSSEHERYKELLRRLVEVLAEEFDRTIGGVGSMTCKRRDLDRGLEPDQCYYLENFPRIRARKRIDLTRDPPPDLALEVEVTSRMLKRVGIYEALAVPELWRFDGKTLSIQVLGNDGKYQQRASSPTFPGVAVKEFVRFIRQGRKNGDIAMVRAFRTWVRKQLAQK